MEPAYLLRRQVMIESIFLHASTTMEHKATKGTERLELHLKTT